MQTEADMPPRYKSNAVTATKMVAKNVCRVVLDTDESVDIPVFCGTFAEGDGVRIEVGKDANNAECVMNGIMYDHTHEFVFISCGGLLFKLKNDGTVGMGNDVSVGVTKIRRRRRGV